MCCCAYNNYIPWNQLKHNKCSFLFSWKKSCRERKRKLKKNTRIEKEKNNEFKEYSPGADMLESAIAKEKKNILKK